MSFILGVLGAPAITSRLVSFSGGAAEVNGGAMALGHPLGGVFSEKQRGAAQT